MNTEASLDDVMRAYLAAMDDHAVLALRRPSDPLKAVC
jgi:hypothetical protein